MRKTHAMRYVRLPKGVATCSGASDFYVWGKAPPYRRMLVPDFDLFYIASGRMAFVWPDGQHFTIEPESFGLIPPLVPIRVERLTGTLSYWFCHFGFRLGPENPSTRMEQDYFGPAPDVHVPAVFTSRQAPGVRDAYRHLAGLKFDVPQPPWRYEAALLRLVGELKFFGWNFSANARKTTEPPVLDARLTSVLQRIHAEPQRAWTVGELAQSVGLSTDRLNTIARSLTNRSVKELIIRSRFERAFTLLRQRPQGELPSIKEVSQQCGFHSQHFFCRQFKHLFQMTPTEFRDQTIQT